jgi:hypothetical protein
MEQVSTTMAPHLLAQLGLGMVAAKRCRSIVLHSFACLGDNVDGLLDDTETEFKLQENAESRIFFPEALFDAGSAIFGSLIGNGRERP